MAKWNEQLPGCSGHVHQSLSDGSTNVFYDEKDPNNMSETFKQYLAGQLHSLPTLITNVCPNYQQLQKTC